MLNQLKVKIFADGANLNDMIEMASKPMIKGLTTNPTLMKKAGVKNYRDFAREVLSVIKDKPISFEVFSDDFSEMERQALEIAGWGENVYVKIPVTNTKGESAAELVRALSRQDVKVNVTAMFRLEEVVTITNALRGGAPSNISIFAGRIADAGQDPLPVMQASVTIANMLGNCEVIWASPREVLNVIQADEVGCHIITATSDIINKLPTLGKDLYEFTLDTVKMFHNDAQNAGYSL